MIWAHKPCLGIDIGKNHLSAYVAASIGRCQERECWHDDVIASCDSCGQQGKMKRSSPATTANSMGYFADSSKVRFKRLCRLPSCQGLTTKNSHDSANVVAVDTLPAVG
jgi:hypothetical protein